jgi:hypothetical protein
VNFRGLAAAFVERVGPYVPDGVELREQPEGFVQAWVDEGRWEAYPVDEPELDDDVDEATYDPAYPAFGVLETLDFLQEFVRNELELEWEGGEPWAEIEDEEIRFGYEGGAGFDPIPLSTLG